LVVIVSEFFNNRRRLKSMNLTTYPAKLLYTKQRSQGCDITLTGEIYD